MKRLEDVKKLEVRSKIVHKTLGTKIYQNLIPDQKKEGRDSPEWGDLLDDFFTAAKQLDDLQHEMKSVFSINIPVPRQVLQEKDRAFPFSIPQLLSPMILKEDSNILVIEPDKTMFGTPLLLEHAERHLLAEHDARIERVLENFNLRVDEWRQESKSGQLLAPVPAPALDNTYSIAPPSAHGVSGDVHARKQKRKHDELVT